MLKCENLPSTNSTKYETQISAKRAHPWELIYSVAVYVNLIKLWWNLLITDRIGSMREGYALYLSVILSTGGGVAREGSGSGQRIWGVGVSRGWPEGDLVQVRGYEELVFPEAGWGSGWLACLGGVSHFSQRGSPIIHKGEGGLPFH